MFKHFSAQTPHGSPHERRRAVAFANGDRFKGDRRWN
jgi:hypothetical protein